MQFVITQAFNGWVLDVRDNPHQDAPSTKYIYSELKHLLEDVPKLKEQFVERATQVITCS